MTKEEISEIEWSYLYDFDHPTRRRPLWEKLRSSILPQWIAEHPCTRPWGWWEHDSRAQGELGDSDPRQKVGGGGEICKYNYSPIYDWGVYRYWHFETDNPPLMESEAAYLERMDLLTEKEKIHLSKNPDLLEPVPINEVGDFRPETRI